MALVYKGAEVAAALNEKNKQLVAELKERGVEPALVLLRVGHREEDVFYERMAIKRCETTGVKAISIVLPADVSQEQLLEQVKNINEDPAVHGCLIFRPLPAHLDEALICEALSPDKDVDGITSGSLAGVFSGSKQGYPPCTAQACMEILKHYNVGLSGKRVCVVGRSLVIGRPVAMLLLAQNATVTICHSRTVDLSSRCAESDIVVACVGSAGLLGAECFRSGQVVLDVGANVGADGSLTGDVCFDAAAALVKGITPVPGGVGSVTTAVLVSHTAQAALRQANRA